MRPLILLVLGVASLAPAQPSIVVILADDLGWADVNANDPLGRTFYRTPAIDALASRGVRFSNAYSNAPNCAPSRAALLTGHAYPRQPIYTVGSGARGRAEHRRLEPPPNETTLPLEQVTIAELLRDAGYATGFVGKWHLGSPPDHGPTAQGFDVNIAGFERGHPASYVSPYDNPALEDGPDGEYLVDRLAREACAFIEQNADGPFFLLYAPYAVHTPLQAPNERIARYRTAPPDRGHHDPTYAAMIEALDDAVARVADTIDRLGIADRTVIVFASDNGGVGGYRAAGVEGARDITDQAPLRGGKGMLYEGGIRVPLIVVWPGLAPAGQTRDDPAILADLLPTFADALDLDAPAGLDGDSLVPVLRAEAAPTRTLVWHFPGYLEASGRAGTWRTTPGTAIRVGRYKLIEFYETGDVELYDLVADPGERRDLAASEPGIAADLHDRLEAWRLERDAPMPRPR